MADNKVNFLRGTSAEYGASTKDNDTFYYTTDDEKLYLGNKEITGGGVTIDDTLSDTSKNPVQNKVINAALNNKANLSDIPTTLPANGGNADTVDGLHANGFIKVNSNSSYDCNTLYDTGLYLCGGSTTNTPNGLIYGTLLVMPYRKPYGNAKSDFCAQIFIPNGDGEDTSLWYRTSLVDSWNEWTRSCDGGNANTVDGKHASDFALKTDIPTSLPANGGNADTVNGRGAYRIATLDANANLWNANAEDINDAYLQWDGSTYFKLKTFGKNLTAVDYATNAATVNGLTVQTAVPANAKFTDTTYGAASTSANGLMTTGAQTFAGNKTFNGQVIPAGASAVGTAQARKIYAGTSDMTAGTTALETGAIYLVYE